MWLLSFNLVLHYYILVFHHAHFDFILIDFLSHSNHIILCILKNSYSSWCCSNHISFNMLKGSDLCGLWYICRTNHLQLLCGLYYYLLLFILISERIKNYNRIWCRWSEITKFYRREMSSFNMPKYKWQEVDLEERYLMKIHFLYMSLSFPWVHSPLSSFLLLLSSFVLHL